MPFVFNGVTITNVIFNGTEITELIFDGVTVFTSTPIPTASTPTITNTAHISTTFYWQVLNNDASTATIWHEASDSTPDLYQDTISGGALTLQRTFVSGLPKITVYAQAKNVSGKDDSIITSKLF